MEMFTVMTWRKKNEIRQEPSAMRTQSIQTEIWKGTDWKMRIPTVGGKKLDLLSVVHWDVSLT